jgi:preprotein translocase subunit SecD
MRSRLRVFVIAAVVALSIWTIHPVQQTIPLGLDLAGGVQLVLRVTLDNVDPAKRSETVEQAMQIIERRVNALGVAEPVVTRYGRDDRILVQLPGVSDLEQAKRIIQRTAQLRLTLVESGPHSSRDAALQAHGNPLPAHLALLTGRAVAGAPAFYVVQRAPAVSGTDLRDARPSIDEFNRPAVAFTLTPTPGVASAHLRSSTSTAGSRPFLMTRSHRWRPSSRASRIEDGLSESAARKWRSRSSRSSRGRCPQIWKWLPITPSVPAWDATPSAPARTCRNIHARLLPP